MKRRRQSTKKRTQENTTHQEPVQGYGASISDVPNPILMDILSRLSVKSIFRCRCVCKSWLEILLDPDFANLHFSRAPACPLLRDSSASRLSRALYLIELERDSIFFDDVSGNSCNLNMKLSTIFILPERESASRTKYMERRFDICNSCNGLLCLRGNDYFNAYPIVIFNPVTGEYSVLPKPEDAEKLGRPICGLGFCPKTNKYKVVLIVSDNPVSRVALIYTLGGLGGWRRIGNAPILHYRNLSPIFMNGVLHWFIGVLEIPMCNMRRSIVSFDFVGEEFSEIPFPPGAGSCRRSKAGEVFQFAGLGVLRGHLYICENTYDGRHIDIWKMKDYGIEDSWFKEYHIDTFSVQRWQLDSWFIEYQPQDFLSNGDLLMYQERSKALISIDKHKLNRCFKIGDTVIGFRSVAHVPSFVSLKDIMGDTLVVYNVRSSLTSSGPRKKIGKRLFLVEEKR